MKGYLFQWRMAGRRRTACLLVLLFTTVVTVFMLMYPRLIDNTRTHLDEAYDSMEVTGWMLNAADYDDPEISGEDWHTLLDSGFFREYASYASINCQIYSKEELNAKAGEDPSDEARLWAMQILLSRSGTKALYALRAYNSLKACDDLLRMSDRIQWLEGYSADCLEGDERICLLPEGSGYVPGDVVPIYVDSSQEMQQGGIIRLKTVGIYPGSVPEFDCVMPLRTYEQLCIDTKDTYKELGLNTEVEFKVNSFVFTVDDNRQLTELKQLLIDMGYDGSGGSADEEGAGDANMENVRTAIDDRILQGTVAPIQSNLALLEGLYRFFFGVIGMIGFFLCFLLARGRKAEYAVMRMLGESMAQITMKTLLEQSILCLMGIILGTLVVTMTGLGSFNPVIGGIILLCYTFGAAVAVLLTVRVNVMEILRDKE